MRPIGDGSHQKKSDPNGLTCGSEKWDDKYVTCFLRKGHRSCHQGQRVDQHGIAWGPMWWWDNEEAGEDGLLSDRL